MSIFKRPGVRYGRTPEPETPYQRAAQAWDERIGSARVQARNWRLMAFGSLALSFGLASGLVWQSARGTITPWVVQVDKLGQAQAVAPASAGYRPSDPEIAWHLARFVEDVRSIPTDPVVLRQDWLQAYDYTSQSGALALNDYARTDDPFAKLGSEQVVGGRLQRHPRFARQLPRGLERAPLQGRRARRDPALERHRHRHAPGPARPGPPASQPARNLRHRPELVQGARLMPASRLLTRLRPHRSLRLRSCGEAAADHLRRRGVQAGAAQADAAPAAPKPVEVVEVSSPLPLPGQLKPLPAAKAEPAEAADPRRRVASANAAARVQPSRDGYLNAVQVYPYTDGALYQVYASPGEITDITLQPGETLAGSGPIAAGDTVRWIIGETESGAGATRRIHVLLKPTRADLSTNLVIDTDRRTYHLELRATPSTYMASVSWRYPEDELVALQAADAAAQASAPVDQGLDLAQLQFRYAITGDSPPWRPLRAFDDGRKVYIEMPAGVAEGELPPLFVVGPGGGTELVNYRVRQNYYVVDRLFAAAELRMGSDKKQAVVRIARADGAPARRAAR